MSAPKALPWLLLLSACGKTSAPVPPRPPSLVAVSRVPGGARAFDGAPPWAGEVEPLPARADGEPSTVPQLRDMADALAMIGAEPATATRGVLVCEIVVARVRAYDEAAFVGLGAPDVSVYVRIDGGPEARARIGEDTFTGRISVPNVTLARGARVDLRLRESRRRRRRAHGRRRGCMERAPLHPHRGLLRHVRPPPLREGRGARRPRAR